MTKLHKDDLAVHMNADPRLNPWGIYSRDPWPGGVKVFFWFQTEADLRTRLADGSFDVDGDEEDWQPAIADMTAALSSISELSPADVDLLNSSTNGGFDIEWVGQFDELLHGNSSMAVELRESWHENGETSNQGLNSIIEPAKVADFANFVKTYGL